MNMIKNAASLLGGLLRNNRSRRDATLRTARGDQFMRGIGDAAPLALLAGMVTRHEGIEPRDRAAAVAAAAGAPSSTALIALGTMVPGRRFSGLRAKSNQLFRTASGFGKANPHVGNVLAQYRQYGRGVGGFAATTPFFIAGAKELTNPGPPPVSQ